MFPAFDLALASWRRAWKVEEAKIAMVEPQTISSILGASERWFIIPAKYIVVGVECDVVVSAPTSWASGNGLPLSQVRC